MFAKKISEIENLIQKQDEWRCQCINLIASENVLSQRARRGLLGLRASLRRRPPRGALLPGDFLYR